MNRRVYILLGAVLALVLVVGWLVGPVQGKNSGSIAVVDMDRVIGEYVAQPLLKARDELQAQFDAESADLEDEVEISRLFSEYQVQLNKLEADYRQKIQDAIAEVAEKQGFQVVLPEAGVLHGGTDITNDVLAVLK